MKCCTGSTKTIKKQTHVEEAPPMVRLPVCLHVLDPHRLKLCLYTSGYIQVEGSVAQTLLRVPSPSATSSDVALGSQRPSSAMLQGGEEPNFMLDTSTALTGPHPPSRPPKPANVNTSASAATPPPLPVKTRARPATSPKRKPISFYKMTSGLTCSAQL
jgi:hypothetical protein